MPEAQCTACGVPVHLTVMPLQDHTAFKLQTPRVIAELQLTILQSSCNRKHLIVVCTADRCPARHPAGESSSQGADLSGSWLLVPLARCCMSGCCWPCSCCTDVIIKTDPKPQTQIGAMQIDQFEGSRRAMLVGCMHALLARQVFVVGILAH